MQTFIDLLQAATVYAIQIGAGILSFSLLFFVYARYKTGKNLKELLQLFFDVIAKAIVFTSFVLGAVFVLIRYVPISHVLIFLLGVSSVSILLKYLLLGLRKKAMIFDVGIILANVYCSYVLMMQEQLDIHHYLLLGFIVFCFFLYQQAKKIS